MREVTQGDIRAAARTLMCWPEGVWPDVMARMLAEAHTADCHRKALGRIHPRLGNGTLMQAAVRMGLAPEPPAATHDCLHAMASAIEAVLVWRMARPARVRSGPPPPTLALRPCCDACQTQHGQTGPWLARPEPEGA